MAFFPGFLMCSAYCESAFASIWIQGAGTMVFFTGGKYDHSSYYEDDYSYVLKVLFKFTKLCDTDLQRNDYIKDLCAK